MAAISLDNPKTIQASDEAGTFIVKSVLPPIRNVFNYKDEMLKHRKKSQFPRLGSFCVRALLDYTDQLYVLGKVRLSCVDIHTCRRDGKRIPKYHLLKSLLPNWGTPFFSLAEIDPRLWASIIQIYEDLPEDLRTLPIQLADPHLPILQQIPPTPNFTLITVLDLSRSQTLTDESILSLKALHNLCALDISSTEVTSRGLRRLSRTLIFNDNGQRRGPWALRILRMRDCRKIDNGIFSFLKDFPLLCAIDASNTQCQCSGRHAHILRPFVLQHYGVSVFKSTLEETVQKFAKAYRNLFAHPTPYILAAQERPVRKEKPPDVKCAKSTPVYTSAHNSFIVFPPSHGSSSKGNWVLSGNTDTVRNILRLGQERQRRGNEAQHREQAQLDFRRELQKAKCRKAIRADYMDDSDNLIPSNDKYDSACSTCDEDTSDSDFSEEGDNHSRGENQSGRNLRVDGHMSLVESFYAQTALLAKPCTFINASSHSADLILSRVPPPWSHLDTLTPDTWHAMEAEEKDTIRTDSMKSEQKNNVKGWHLSLAKRRKPDDPEPLQRSPSPTPTLVNPPSPSPSSSLSEAPAGRNCPRPGSIISQDKEKMPRTVYKRPRLKLEPDIISPFASHNNQGQSAFKFKPPSVGPRGYAGETNCPAPRKSSTIQKLYDRKSGITQKTDKIDRFPEASKPRSTPDRRDKKSAKMSHSTKPNLAFDWKGWSGKC